LVVEEEDSLLVEEEDNLLVEYLGGRRRRELVGRIFGGRRRR